MIRCVVFDFDGTLVESNHIKRQAFFDVVGDFEGGAPLMTSILRAATDKDRYWVFGEFASALPSGADSTELADRYTRICQERIANAPEIGGAKVSLERLRTGGKQLFVNSATPVDALTTLVCLRQLDTFFEGIYGSPAKKHENLESIRVQHGFALEEMLVVGDGESDRLSAETLGCHFVAVESAENNFLQEPSCRIPDMVDLPGIIFSIS
ncbi:MAG: HAD hydrolase-like protein [Sulfuritalea sp.]|nr:HAD hydrolase-like protein [Sulfuritalea sp.]